jgi:carbamoyltransferase
VKWLLGINCSGFQSAACVVSPEGVRTAICEERLSRQKHDRSFPLRAIRYCLDAAGIALEDVEAAFVGWHPRFYLRSSDGMLADAFRHRGKIAYLALNELATLTGQELSDVSQALHLEGARLDIRFVDHHRAHVANVFLRSGFESADFLVLDGWGEVSTGALGRVGPDGIQPMRSFRTPHSLGTFYSTFTDHLGYRPNRDEWKVMALAARGDPERFTPAVRELIHVVDGSLEVDLSYFEHFLFFTPRYYSPKFVARFGEPLAPGAEPTQRHCDLVAAAQRVAEEVVFELLRGLSEGSPNRRLVVGGGFFMNSVCNGKLLSRTPYEEVYVGGSPDDSGIAIGSALHGARYESGWSLPVARSDHNFLGRPYDPAECQAALDLRKLSYQRLDDPAGTAASLLAQGKILGWFQGGSEFGPRALGHRSILADPARAEMKQAVNASVKFREGFRPFAPAALVEKQSEIFPDLDPGSAYFMEKVVDVHPAWRPRIPAVVHFDGSGRVQTVDGRVNPLFHALIAKFEASTGIPVVLNTSFNTSGMPLVETPGDAIGCFYNSGLDALVLGEFLVEK